MKILVLCTGNSCRSQIAHGYLQHFAGKRAEVQPERRPRDVNPRVHRHPGRTASTSVTTAEQQRTNTASCPSTARSPCEANGALPRSHHGASTTVISRIPRRQRAARTPDGRIRKGATAAPSPLTLLNAMCRSSTPRISHHPPLAAVKPARLQGALHASALTGELAGSEMQRIDLGDQPRTSAAIPIWLTQPMMAVIDFGSIARAGRDDPSLTVVESDKIFTTWPLRVAS
ncbi:MAG: hypothetical protein IPM46_14060 [Flavobacteriales bacterium]|nr:hypothetical protein [Flavobacteriales bacterium]